MITKKRSIMKKLIIIILAVCFLMACATAPKVISSDPSKPADELTAMQKTEKALTDAAEWVKEDLKKNWLSWILGWWAASP